MFLPRLRAYSSLIGIVAGSKNGSRTSGRLTNSGSDAGLTAASGISIQKLEAQATRLKARRDRYVYCGGRATQVRHPARYVICPRSIFASINESLT